MPFHKEGRYRGETAGDRQRGDGGEPEERHGERHMRRDRGNETEDRDRRSKIDG